MAEEKKKSLKITRASDVTKEKIAEVNKILAEIESGKAKPVAELEAKGWTREQIDAVRLAFVHEAPVNWSPDLGTVLANEEVEEWRSKGHIVERRPLRQWMLRITKYAQRLIDELEPLD